MSQITQEEIDKYIKDTQKDFKRNAAILALLFTLFGVAIYLVLINMPQFTDRELDILLRIPRNPRELAMMEKVVENYSQTYHYEVLGAF